MRVVLGGEVKALFMVIHHLPTKQVISMLQDIYEGGGWG